jgi:lambda family phage portal protein
MRLVDRIKSALMPPVPAPPVVAPPPRVARRTVPPARIQGRSFFDAAGTGRLLDDWSVSNTTADKELSSVLDSLRARSRQMFFNDPYLRKFIKLLENNVIGPSGILLGAKAKANDGTLDTYDNRQIEAAWYGWAKRGNCDVSKSYSFVDIQKQIMRAVAIDGEIFIEKMRAGRAGNESGFALRLYEADWLATRYTTRLGNGNTVRMGVELNANEEAVAYYFYKYNPADDRMISQVQSEMTRVPADAIIHVFYRDRVTQHRGAPWAICTMLSLRHINKYIESEVVASRVAAAQMGFIKTPSGTEFTGDTDETDIEIEVEPGIFKQLPRGWDIKEFNPQHPSTQFQNFIKSMVRGVAVGLGVGYSNLSSDRESVNYSSLRQEALEERDNWMTLQSWFIDNVMDPIYNEWLDMALTFQLKLPQSKIKKFQDVVWYPRRWAWVDPQKDINAAVIELQNRLTSRTKILSEQGVDFEQLVQEIAAENELMQKYGITPEKVDKAAGIQPQEEEDEQAKTKAIQ